MVAAQAASKSTYHSVVGHEGRGQRVDELGAVGSQAVQARRDVVQLLLVQPEGRGEQSGQA